MDIPQNKQQYKRLACELAGWLVSALATFPALYLVVMLLDNKNGQMDVSLVTLSFQFIDWACMGVSMLFAIRTTVHASIRALLCIVSVLVVQYLSRLVAVAYFAHNLKLDL
ncbi:MAG: hypothetical protein C0404_00085 [Verrucomicrobia bacterium]|nr:hypothetical protein [Verrucomicrobiota bacterium]